MRQQHEHMLQIRSRYERALQEGAESYRDPATGGAVFTERALRARGECCGFGCRHCPYAYSAVPRWRRGRLGSPLLLEPEGPDSPAARR
jgi:hypothetical protein